MYSPEIQPEQVEKLYFIRENRRRINGRATMTGIVREALERYFAEVEKEIDRGEDLVIEKDFALKAEEERHVKEKIRLAKKRFHPEKLKLLEKMERWDKTERMKRGNAICSECGSGMTDGMCENCEALDE